MAIPVYNLATMPAIVYPIKQTQPKTRKFLGGLAIVEPTKISFTIKCKSNNEMKALKNFWIVDCNYGTSPFKITLPLFGQEQTITCRFTGDLVAEANGCVWTVNVEGEVDSGLIETTYSY